MRIGIFTDTYPPYINGVSTSIVMLQHALEKLGHEVYVVTANLESFHYEYDEEEREDNSHIMTILLLVLIFLVSCFIFWAYRKMGGFPWNIK